MNAAARPPPATWQIVSSRGRRARATGMVGIYALLGAASLPILVPYLALVTTAFGPRDPAVIWRTVLVSLAFILALLLISGAPGSRARARVSFVLATVAFAAGLWAVAGKDLHLGNFAFLLTPPRPSLPSFWSALFNSAVLAISQTAIVLVVASLAGYYMSRFSFPGRSGAVATLLVVHAFPVMTLIIPLFLMIWWAGLLNSLAGVVLILVAIELPFAIILMKGFFDAVPWEIEMSALTDGASRRQAFLFVVLPQVSRGLIAVGVFTFVRGWEEYVFVSVLLVTQPKWVLSLYLFYENNAPAVALAYMLPPALLFVFTQKYLTNIAFVGKG